MLSIRIACALALTTIFATQPTFADNAVAAWRCWYAGAGNLACIVEQVSTTNAVSPVAYTPSSHTPDILRTLRTDPASLQDRVLIIPLHTEPRDMAFAAQLAKLTVCGANPSCGFRFTTLAPELPLTH